MAKFNSNYGRRDSYMQVVVNPRAYNTSANTTIVDWEVWVYTGVTYWQGNTQASSLTINGGSSLWSIARSDTYAVRKWYKLGSGNKTIEHNSDGTKSIAISARLTIDAGGTGPGALSIDTSMTLPTIPRASSFTLGGSTETGSAVSVTISRASSSFTHRVRWRIGSGAWTTSATAATTSSSVTVPHTAIPSSNSASVTIAVQTFSGTTAIGSEVSATRTLTVPASLLPTIGAVTATENVSEVSTNVGAFVKGKSKLNLAITGASGASGSTIKGYKITLTGTTINASSGVSNLVTTSGNVVITGTVTDSRGRTGSKTLTINVLDYAAPTLTGLAFYRSNSAGVADPTGTYVTVKGTVTVSSLIVGTTQKNKVSYNAQHDKSGSFASFITESPNVITKAYTNILPSFTIDKTFNFRSRAGDIFGYGGWSVGVVPSGEVTQQWGRKTTSFGKMIDDTGYNVQVGTGGIQSDGPIVAGKGIRIPDTRSIVSVPKELPDYAVSFEFKQNASVGNPPITASSSYSHIINVAGWDTNGGSGGWPSQISVGANGLAVRQATGATTWGSWTKLSLPADFIVERDSTLSVTNGYEKWNSGLLRVWARGTIASLAGGATGSIDIISPVSLISGGNVQATIRTANVVDELSLARALVNTTMGGRGGANVRIKNWSSATRTGIEIQVEIVSKWK